MGSKLGSVHLLATLYTSGTKLLVSGGDWCGFWLGRGRIDVLARLCLRVLDSPRIGVLSSPAGGDVFGYACLEGGSFGSLWTLPACPVGRAPGSLRSWRLGQEPALALSIRAVEKLVGCPHAVSDVDALEFALYHSDEEEADVATAIGPFY